MRYSFYYLLFVALVLFSCSEEKKNDSAPITEEQSKELYISNCARCHGPTGDMGLGGAKKLTESTLPLEEVTAQIRYGKNAMPPFTEMLTTKEIKAVAQYTVQLRLNP